MPSAVEIWTSIGTLASLATCAAAIEALEHHSPISIADAVLADQLVGRGVGGPWRARPVRELQLETMVAGQMLLVDFAGRELRRDSGRTSSPRRAAGQRQDDPDLEDVRRRRRRVAAARRQGGERRRDEKTQTRIASRTNDLRPSDADPVSGGDQSEVASYPTARAAIDASRIAVRKSPGWLQSPTSTYGTPAASIAGTTSRFGSGPIATITTSPGSITSALTPPVNDEPAGGHRLDSGPGQNARLPTLEASQHLEPVVARHLRRPRGRPSRGS